MGNILIEQYRVADLRGLGGAREIADGIKSAHFRAGAYPEVRHLLDVALLALADAVLVRIDD